MIDRAADSQAAIRQAEGADGAPQTTRTNRRSGDFEALFRAVSDEASGARRLPGAGNNPGERPAPGAVSASPKTEAPPPDLARVNLRGRVGSGNAVPSEAAAPGETISSFGGFVKTADERAPHLVRFAEVPDSAKQPLGPYKQAPAEFGGDWWQVNPFTGPEPWLRLEATPAAEALPEGFADLFGPRPKPSDFQSNWDYRVAKVGWEQELKHFGGTGIPEGTDPAKLDEATQAFEEWGLGRPVFFQDRYGWRVRFPDSQIPSFGGSPNTAIEAPHVLIANYQVNLIREGGTPERLHPWLPNHMGTDTGTDDSA